MADWATGIQAVTLFTEDLEASTAFYVSVFEKPLHYSDDDSAVFRFGGTLVNLLRAEAAPELVDPLLPGEPDAAPRSVMTIGVDDVDTVCARLRDIGVAFVNGPVDRPWGIRTASFRDPAGHLWEIAH